MNLGNDPESKAIDELTSRFALLASLTENMEGSDDARKIYGLTEHVLHGQDASAEEAREVLRVMEQARIPQMKNILREQRKEIERIVGQLE